MEPKNIFYVLIKTVYGTRFDVLFYDLEDIARRRHQLEVKGHTLSGKKYSFATIVGITERTYTGEYVRSVDPDHHSVRSIHAD